MLEKSATGAAGTRRKGFGDMKDEFSWEADIQMAAKLRPLMDEDGNEYPLKLKTPHDLMQIFENLEEQNLFLIR